MALSCLDLALAIAAISAGALVQGMVGFGLAIVSAPVLYLINPALVPGSIIVTLVMSGLLTTRRYARDLRLSDLKYAIVGRVPGSLLGAWLLTIVSARSMNLVLGGSVLVAVIVSMLPIRFEANRSSLFAAGVLSGVMGTASSIGGPPMALVMQNEGGDRIRANLSAFFVVSSCISLAVLAYGGLFQTEHFLYGLCMLPGVFIGSWQAGWLAHKVNKKIMKRVLLFLCSFSGLGAMWSALH